MTEDTTGAQSDHRDVQVEPKSNQKETNQAHPASREAAQARPRDAQEVQIDLKCCPREPKRFEFITGAAEEVAIDFKKGT